MRAALCRWVWGQLAARARGKRPWRAGCGAPLGATERAVTTTITTASTKSVFPELGLG